MTDFNDELEKKVKLINGVIKKFYSDETDFQIRLSEAMNYSVRVGGKRIRPMIMLEAYKLCGGKNQELVYPFMAALEFIHTYSLVHDDLPAMDNDMYRRGQLTTHAKYGEDFGILAGDGLLNLAYETMLNAIVASDDQQFRMGAVRAAAIIGAKAGYKGMVGGQSLDVLLTDKPVNAEQLDFIFRLKTGALLEAAFMAGAALAGADDETIALMCQAGNKVGVAFQIKDDILDVTSTQEELGKPILSDEKNNKTTYVTLYGLDKAQSDVDLFSKEAVDILTGIGDNEFLNDLVLFMIDRKK